MAPADFETLRSAEERTRKAPFEDGFDELFGGIGSLLVALAFWLPSGSRVATCAAVVIALIVFAWTQGGVRRKVTAPRTGVVRPRLPLYVSNPTASRLLFLGFVACGAILGWIEGALNVSLLPVVPFVVSFVAILLQARRTGLARLYALAVVPIVVAVIAWPIEEGSVRDVPMLFGSVGLGLVVTGAWTLRGYLRTHHEPAAEG